MRDNENALHSDEQPAETEPSAARTRNQRGHKRGHGEGSIYQRSDDGLWVGSIMVGRKTSGRPDRRVVYGKTRREVQKKLDDLRRRATLGLLPPAKVERHDNTVKVYLDRWLAAKQHTVRIKTHERYATLMRLHVLPVFGRTKLDLLRPDALERLYATKLDEGLSPRTVHHIHTVLHTALEQAVKWGYTGRNVCDAVTPPRVPKGEMRALTGEEVGRVLDGAVLAGDRLQALWTVAVYTGMRLGELLGLTWSNTDLEAGQLYVRRVLVDVHDREPVWGEPKTKRSRRDVDLPQEALDALIAHRDRQRFEREQLGQYYANYDLVFATQIGSPLQRKVVQEAFKRALARVDLPASVRFHDLRHAAATLMLASGEDIPTVAAVLGHSQNSTTLNIYAHAVRQKVRKATSAIQRAVRGARARQLSQ